MNSIPITIADFNSTEFEIKSFGEKNNKLNMKNKILPRKVRGVHYAEVRSHESAHKACRMFTKANLSTIIKYDDTEKVDEFMYPLKNTNTYNWYDCKPRSPKYWI